MSFEFTTPTTAKLTSVTPRTETHGDAKVFAISLGLSIEGPNTLLDKLSPTLRQALYKRADDTTETLPGVEEATPLLRAAGIELLTLKGELNGWTLAVHHGIDDEAPIKLGDAKVDAFKVHPKQGGTVELKFRVGSNDIDATEAGLLCSKLSQEIEFELTAPVIKEGAATEATGAQIDGSVDAFKKDHPDLFNGGDGPTPEDALAHAVDDDQLQGDPDEHDDDAIERAHGITGGASLAPEGQQP